MGHENSRTVQVGNKYRNVDASGKSLSIVFPFERLEYSTKEEAVLAAQRRSRLGGRPTRSRGQKIVEPLRRVASKVGTVIGDINMELSDLIGPEARMIKKMEKEGAIRRAKPDIPTGVFPSKVVVYEAVPGKMNMSKGEGFQAGKRVVMGSVEDWPTLVHEMTHVDQSRRWGPLFPVIQSLLAAEARRRKQDIYDPKGIYPFEREAMARQEREIRKMKFKTRGR